MQISQKSTNIIENCRFCWMCRHICPIGNATGQERNTARARALSLSVVLKEGAPFSADIIDNLYECALCGACTHDCATGFDPVAFTKDARLAAALEGKMPPYVQKLLENIETTGNIFGKKRRRRSCKPPLRRLTNGRIRSCFSEKTRSIKPRSRRSRPSSL